VGLYNLRHVIGLRLFFGAVHPLILGRDGVPVGDPRQVLLLHHFGHKGLNPVVFRWVLELFNHKKNVQEEDRNEQRVR